MGRSVRQKRKNRSSRAVVKTHNKSNKQLNPLGNDIIARNWNKNETLTQNYRRLGLVTKLQKVAGGSEPTITRASATASKASRTRIDPLNINPALSGAGAGKAGASSNGLLREVRVERDADGRIVRVLDRAPNPLGDPLNELDSDSEEEEVARPQWDEHEWGGLSDHEDEDDEGKTEVVRQLEREARRPVYKTPRHQSEKEVEWLQRLVDRYGDDVQAMARDRKLNPMQQTAADLAKRIKKWRKSEA